MKNTKRVLSLVLVFVMLLSSTAVFAANGDVFKRSDDSFFASSAQLTLNPALGNQVTLQPGQYKYELDGYYYKVEDLLAAFALDNVNFLALLKSNYTPLGPVGGTTPVPGTYKIMLSAKKTSLVGDGYTNTTIEVQLVDSITGQRANVNGLEVRLATTYGQLADQFVILQNGYAHTTINSEAVQRRTDVDIDAQVIEGTVPVAYKNKIDGMTAKLGLIFTTPGGARLEDIPRLLKAESNQADRVTLFFDRNVDPAEFLTGAVVDVWQAVNDPVEMGFHRLPGNDPHTVEVILRKDLVLIDNKWVYVDLELTRDGHTLYVPAVSFILTDNRKPRVTEVVHDGNMRTIDVYFSEAIDTAQFSLDGGTSLINNVTYHDFDSINQIDDRHIVTLDVEYLAPGEHILQVSAPKDFAYRTDLENIGTTQELRFTVLPNDTLPRARAIVESPEQYRIFLENADSLNGSLQDIRLESDYFGTWQEVELNIAGNPLTYPDLYAGRYKRWIVPEGTGNKELAWVTQYGSYEELVVETNTDWTFVYQTGTSGEEYYDYNYRLVIPAGMFTNLDNDLSNGEIILPIELERDDVSPVLVDQPEKIDVTWGKFDLLYDEPVKGVGLSTYVPAGNNIREEDEVEETPSQLQDITTALPNIVVEYKGKNASGASVTIYGGAYRYESLRGEDKEFRIMSEVSLQDLVDYECYKEDWELVVRNVTDDIGNAAITLVHPFKVPAKGAPGRLFKIVEAVIADGTVNVNLPTHVNASTLHDDYDIVYVEYSDYIRIVGNDDSAVNKSNYKLNGRDLGEDSFVLVDKDSYHKGKWDCLCRYDFEGYHGVYIFTPKNSVLNTAADPDNPDKEVSNTLEVNENLMSKNFAWAAGDKLTHDYEVELDYYDEDYYNCPGVCNPIQP